MRVRLYEVGAAKPGVVLIDQFPAALALTETGRVGPTDRKSREICCLEDVGGQIVLRRRDADSELEVNDAAMEEGPLQPGDRLRIGGLSYLVSYELTATREPVISRYRIQR